MTNEEAIEILKLYKQRLEEAVSTELGNDIKAFEMAISSLENNYNSAEQTDRDLISRSDLLNKIWQKEYGKDYDGVNLLNIPHIDIIEQMPSAENTAEWVALDDYPSEDWECDNCGYMIAGVVEPYRFCPNCGKKMWK